MNKPTLVLKPSIHKGLDVIQLHFDRNEVLINLLRNIKSLRWSKTMRCWYLPNLSECKKHLFYLVREHAYLNYEALKKQKSLELLPPAVLVAGRAVHRNKTDHLLPALNEEQKNKLVLFKRWMQSRRYSANTILTYCDALSIFLRYYSNKRLSDLSNADLVSFNNDYIIKYRLSASFQNQTVNAIKLFFRTLEHRSMETDLIHRPKRAKLLPNVLSKEEVKQLLNAQNNVKHRLMLSLIYSCGLRCGELLRLKKEDIDRNRGVIVVRQSKGKKDRIVPLSGKIVELLDMYYGVFKPECYVFEGQVGGVSYDERSLQQVLKNALMRSGIDKPVTLHWLRHSYATHLLESGTDLRYIQEILGHSSSKTTEIYTHVSMKHIQKIVSPFDSL